MSTLGVPEGYAARTHALSLDAESPRYAGCTQSYAGRTRPRCKTLICLVHYLKGAKAHFSASISVSETLRESLPSSLVCVSVVGANCALVT